jgi:exodeoxyribonuclease-3
MMICKNMKIVSRNVNGIRAVINKDFFPWLKSINPDIICLQEVKAFTHQIPPEVRFHFSDYDFVWHAGTRAGYAGTAIFYRKGLAVLGTRSQFDDACFHEDGRMTELSFSHAGKDFVLLNGYFPNGNPRSDGTEMLGYKLAFYERFREYVSTLRQN